MSTIFILFGFRSPQPLRWQVGPPYRIMRTEDLGPEMSKSRPSSDMKKMQK